jgi:ribosomal protein S18 acetylase RimI-like enzyme
MNLIPSQWSTPTFICEDMQSFEIGFVQELYMASAPVTLWDGKEHDPHYIELSYHEGILPEGGVKERFRIQTVRMKSTEEIIGFVSVYHGYPEGDSLYLAMMCISGDFQNQGYGQEVMKHFLLEASLLGYSEVRVNVSLRNWAGLRFWNKSGFNYISGIFGDKEFAEGKFADIELINRW